MNEHQAAQRLIELHPNSDPRTIRELAPLVIEFDCVDLMDLDVLLATLHKWRDVLTTLGSSGMTVDGLLNYEYPNLPGLKLCQRLEGVTIEKDEGNITYLQPSPALCEDGAPLISDFFPVPAANDEGLVWLRVQGSYAIVDGVPLLVV